MLSNQKIDVSVAKPIYYCYRGNADVDVETHLEFELAHEVYVLATAPSAKHSTPTTTTSTRHNG